MSIKEVKDAWRNFEHETLEKLKELENATGMQLHGDIHVHRGALSDNYKLIWLRTKPEFSRSYE